VIQHHEQYPIRVANGFAHIDFDLSHPQCCIAVSVVEFISFLFYRKPLLPDKENDPPQLTDNQGGSWRVV
jgi:hypothetical protein